MVPKRYSVIYADPPWAYRNYGYAETASGQRAKRGVVKEYSTMTMQEIATLPVRQIAADDSTLFLWVTMPLLEEVFNSGLFPFWGFEYKTCAFVWVKQNAANDRKYPQLFFPTDKEALNIFWGMGNWTRQNVELCLLGTRGSPKRQNQSVHQVIHAPVAEHSKKPNEARSRIFQLMGDVLRVELFAREATEGWDVWGDEVESTVPLTPVKPMKACFRCGATYGGDSVGCSPCF